MIFKKLLTFALLSLACVMQSRAQVTCPPNLDFELGTYANWHYFKDGGGGTGCCPISTPVYCGLGVPCTTPTVRQQLMTGAGTDPCCSFPVVPPGSGTYTLKLGNSSTNYEAEKVRYFINVPSSAATYSLFYRYAIVLQDASHSAADQPRFEVKAYDSATNAPLPCAQFSYVTSVSLPGFYSVTTAPCGTTYTPIRCKAWTTQSLNLSGMGGTTVAVDFATGDCGAGAHFGYAYVDLTCGLFQISASSCAGEPVNLTAPSGFAFYSWYDSTTWAPLLGTLQTLTLPAPTDTHTYAVVLTPYPGFGCADTIYTHVFPTDLHIHPSNDTLICPGATVRLTDSATDIVASTITHTWSPATGLSCSTCPVVWASPTVTTVYTVTATNGMGCAKTDTIRVEVVNIGVSSVTVTNPTVCGLNDGTATLLGLPALQPDTVTYTDALGTHIITGVTAADGSITLTGLVGYSSGVAGATYTFFVKMGLCTTTATAVLMDPPPIMPSFDTMVSLGCAGDTIRFINTTVPAGYFSFWTFGDGLWVDPSTNPVHVFNTVDSTPRYTGHFWITLAYNTTPSRMPHCEASTQLLFAPDHQINAGFHTHADTLCLGVPFTFVNTSTAQFGPSSYLWTYQGGVDTITANLADSPTHVYPVAGYYTPTLTVTDGLGCIDTATYPVEVVSINLKAGFGHLSYTLPNGDTSVCLYNSASGIPDSIHLRVYDSVVYSQKFLGSPAYHVDWLWTASGSNPTNGGLGSYNTQFPTFAGLGDFVYTVTATTNSYRCTESKEVLIHSHPPVVLTDLTPNGTVVPLGSTLQLNAAGAVYYWWTPDNGTLNDNNISNPVATPHDTMTIYTVHGMSLYGCPAQADIVVYVDNNTDEFVPSAFTPNGDGLNDVFRPMKLKSQKLVDFRVFNRWGEQLFQTITPDAGWDGTFKGVKQDMGTYHYTITIQRPDGKEKVMKGTVDLIK